jgi:deazaflavin-dependent oxidoreductase (nitroreductase family)
MKQKRYRVFRNFNKIILNPVLVKLIEWRLVNHPIIYHVGRRSGKQYSNPVKAVIHKNNIFIPLTYGPNTDWYLNVRAAGNCRVLIDGKLLETNKPEHVGIKEAASAFPNLSNGHVWLAHFLMLTITESK